MIYKFFYFISTIFYCPLKLLIVVSVPASLWGFILILFLFLAKIIEQPSFRKLFILDYPQFQIIRPFMKVCTSWYDSVQQDWVWRFVATTADLWTTQVSTAQTCLPDFFSLNTYNSTSRNAWSWLDACMQKQGYGVTNWQVIHSFQLHKSAPPNPHVLQGSNYFHLSDILSSRVEAIKSIAITLFFTICTP